MPQAAQVLTARVSRRGWRRAIHPTQTELEASVARAIDDMRTQAGHVRFRSLDGLQDFICTRVRQELQVAVNADYDADEVDAADIETGGILLKIYTDRAGPVYVLMAPAPIKPMAPVPTVGLTARGRS